MTSETSSAFFSRKVLTTCGSKEHAVQIPAAIPMTCVQFIFLILQIFSQFMKKIFLLLISFFLFSCHSRWTEKNRSEFLSSCIAGATKDMGATKAKAYCQCMLEKIVR